MFLQKLQLDENQSYSTTANLDNLTENLCITFNHIPVITPFPSKSEQMEKIKNKLKVPKSISVMDVATFLELEDSFDCSHVVICEKELFEKFGIDISQIKRPYIYLEDDTYHDKTYDGKPPLPKLQLCRFSMKLQKEDGFSALFILSKLFTGTVVARKTERLKIFFKVFQIEWKIVDFSELANLANSKELGECLVFMEWPNELAVDVLLQIERVFCIGFHKKGFEPFSMDLSVAGKYKYRIGDVYRAITPAVLKGSRPFDYKRFSKVCDA